MILGAVPWLRLWLRVVLIVRVLPPMLFLLGLGHLFVRPALPSLHSSPDNGSVTTQVSLGFVGPIGLLTCEIRAAEAQERIGWARNMWAWIHNVSRTIVDRTCTRLPSSATVFFRAHVFCFAGMRFQMGAIAFGIYNAERGVWSTFIASVDASLYAGLRVSTSFRFRDCGTLTPL